MGSGLLSSAGCGGFILVDKVVLGGDAGEMVSLKVVVCPQGRLMSF